MLNAATEMKVMISRMVINPGLLVILLAGIYLASDLHQWKLLLGRPVGGWRR